MPASQITFDFPLTAVLTRSTGALRAGIAECSLMFHLMVCLFVYLFVLLSKGYSMTMHGICSPSVDIGPNPASCTPHPAPPRLQATQPRRVLYCTRRSARKFISPRNTALRTQADLSQILHTTTIALSILNLLPICQSIGSITERSD
jgi:hypothetical protein